MLELWLLTAAVVAWWLWSGRTLAGIGLGVPGGWGFWIGLLVVVAAAIVLGRQVAAVRASAEAQEQVRRQLEGAVGAGAGLMIPRDDHERRVWVGLSLTAGVCEEVLYRAFLIGYLMAWLPMIVAAALASVVFGAAHGYLGRGGMVRAMVTGAFLAVAYLWTGSIWVPIALHAVLDVTSGLTGSVALGDEG